MIIREIMEILHTTGIHKHVGDPKKVRKKRFHLLPPIKGEIEGSLFSIFSLIVVNTGNTQMIAAWYKTYIRCFGEEMKQR
jgi:hypothetical protein